MFIPSHDNNQLFVQTYGDNTHPPMIFSHSLGTNHSLWEKQIATLSDKFFIITYDTRGHGQSSSQHTPWQLKDLGMDVITILDYFSIHQAAFCGISMGGITGLWLARHYAPRFSQFFICNTAAKLGEVQQWIERRDMALRNGLQPMTATIGTRWFTPHFAAQHPHIMQRLSQQMVLGTPQGYAYCCEALAYADIREELPYIQANITLIAGEYDPITPIAGLRYLHQHIKSSTLFTLPCAHISNIECANQFNQILQSSLPPLKISLPY